MQIYPAMRSGMGRWDYYIVKMNMREIAESVNFAHDIYEDRTLDDAVQRVLNTSRVKKDIVTYLAKQKDRFFASIVIAAKGGNPNWHPVYITDDPQFAIFASDDRLNNTFGVLTFDGTQEYFALDGQHRLAAIKSLLDPDEPSSDVAPEGFLEEEVSVLVVVPTEADTEEEFLKRYRRLFGNLNRYAKPMDNATNIIMDEDDPFAIVTRRLISQHPFFSVTGPEKDSYKVKTTKGKNLKSTDSFFTSIETLYSMNVTLLTSKERKNDGWSFSDELGPSTNEFSRFRPSEDVLDLLFEELKMYWDGLIAELPDLQRSPELMRNHAADPESPDFDPEDESTDHLLFWPIGQQLLAELSRDLLDYRLADPSKPTPEGARAALEGLSQLEWRLHQPPWRHHTLVQDSSNGSWRIRSEERKAVINNGQQIQAVLLGLAELDEAGLEELRAQWRSFLMPSEVEDREAEMWESVMRRAVDA
jgi:DNA sulfur modification protein DndB